MNYGRESVHLSRMEVVSQVRRAPVSQSRGAGFQPAKILHSAKTWQHFLAGLCNATVAGSGDPPQQRGVLWRGLPTLPLPATAGLPDVGRIGNPSYVPETCGRLTW